MTPETETPRSLAVIAGSGFCLPNGGIAVFSKSEQVPELQIGWPVLWARHAVAAGYNPDGFVFETLGGKIRIFKTDDDFNWEIL
tara:strand:- start:665 stop:916 length:252 start_codon:yes stop_codon:yes gene_type:complete